MRPGPRLERADDPARCRTARERANHADNDVNDGWQVDPEAEPGGEEGAADELAFRTDVEKPGLEGDGDREPGQDERCGVDRGLRQWREDSANRATVKGGRDGVRVQDRALEHRRVGGRRGIPRAIALPGAAKGVLHACRTGGSVKAISRPPMTMATTIASVVTTAEALEDRVDDGPAG